MADVLAHVGACLRSDLLAPPGVNRPEIAMILACLEEAMALGDRETRNAVALSFARDAEMEQFFIHLKPLLGPRLHAQLNGH